MLHIGFLGCGAIGSYLVKEIYAGRVGESKVVGVFDENEKKVREKLTAFIKVIPIFSTMEELLSQSPDLVVEAASQNAVQIHAKTVLEKGTDFLVMSTGALVDKPLLAELIRIARTKKCRLYLPSGAIGGLDIVQAACTSEIDELLLTTRKPPTSLPRNLAKTPDSEHVIFEGTVEEAVRRLPQNINVSATLSLAAGESINPKVKILVDRRVSHNSHQISIRGVFGEAVIHTKNVPFPENPASSLLAAQSAVAMIKKIASPVWVG